ARLPDARAGPAGRHPRAPVRRRHGVRAARAEVRSEPLPLEGAQGQNSLGSAPGTLFSAGASARDSGKVTVITTAHEPPPTRQLSAPALEALLKSDTAIEPVDVRTEEERAIVGGT